jgi:hypothetical protein
MGTWGAGIFSNDLACDVAAAYRSCLLEGHDGQAVTDKMLNDFRDSIGDRDDGPAFWLALAAIQWRYGRLDQSVSQRALEVIAHGGGIAGFSGKPALQRARARVLEALRQRLLSPQRPPAKVRRPPPLVCDWQPGEIVGFRRQSGEWIALHVLQVVESDIGRYPEVCVLDVPFRLAHEATAETRVCDVHGQDFHGNTFYIIGLKKRDRDSDRLHRTHNILHSPIAVRKGKVGPPYVVWKFLDAYLTRSVKIAFG